METKTKKTMKKLTIILVLMAFMSCEKQETYQPLVVQPISENLTEVKSEITYSLIDIIGEDHKVNVSDIYRIEVTYKVKGEKHYICYVVRSLEFNDSIDQFILKIRNEKLIERKHFPEEIKIEMFDQAGNRIVNGMTGFDYTGSFKDDYIERYYKKYPVSFTPGISEIIIDSVYTVDQFLNGFEFENGVNTMRIDFLDNNMDVTHSYFDRFNELHQFPYVRFNVNPYEKTRYNVSYVKFYYLHQIPMIYETIILSENIISVE